MKQLAFITEKLALEQEVAIRDFLGENGYGFWHRLPNFWLVTVPDNVTSRSLAKALREHRFNGIDFFVSEFEPDRAQFQLAPGNVEWFERHWGIETVDLNAEKM